MVEAGLSVQPCFNKEIDMISLPSYGRIRIQATPAFLLPPLFFAHTKHTLRTHTAIDLNPQGIGVRPHPGQRLVHFLCLLTVFFKKSIFSN